MTAVRGPRGFVLLDRLEDLRPGEGAVATVCFHADDPVFDDHFPGRPIVPGVLLTESMAQVAGWLVAATLRFERWPLLVMIDRAKFGRFVKPGEPLTIQARLVAQGTDIFEAQCAVRAGEARVASARLVFHAFAFDADRPEERRHLAWARTTFSRLGGDRFMAGPGGVETGEC
jgi:3-hydroxyacyl-[acyl-carrier-protein] dehydratase